MDPNEYRRKLEQYVVINNTEPGDDHADITQARCYSGGNEILSWHPGECQDCGEITNKPIRRQINRLRVSGWRERCMNCNKLRNPETGEFDMVFGEITSEHTRQIATLRYQLRKRLATTGSCPNESKRDSAASAAEHESPEP